MNTNITKRLESLERAIAANLQAANLPDPFETLSEENRGGLRPYHEALKRGDAVGVEWPPEVHRARYRHLKACAQQPSGQIGETLRRGRPMGQQGELTRQI